MRIKDLPVEDMTPEQRSIRDDIVAGPRGQLQGPLKVWLTSPHLADKAQKLGQFCRYETSLPPHLSELAILCLLYTSPSPRDATLSRMPSSA